MKKRVSKNTWLGIGLILFIASTTTIAAFLLTRAPSSSALPPPTTTELMAGWRASEYGTNGGPDGYNQQSKNPAYWIDAANSLKAKIGASVAGGVWVIGETNGAGYPTSTYLSFPQPSGNGSYPNIVFASSDANEAYLTAFDSAGIKVYLEVEPCSADMNQLIGLVLGRYGNHSCVIGFGVDCEWWHCADNHNGMPVTNAEAQAWEAEVKSFNSTYELFLKHFDVGNMPTSFRGNILFVDDTQGFSNLSSMISEFHSWADAFGNVAFQIGYPADKSWWSRYSDPMKTISDSILTALPHCAGIFWVDFSIKYLYP